MAKEKCFVARVEESISDKSGKGMIIRNGLASVIIDDSSRNFPFKANDYCDSDSDQSNINIDEKCLITSNNFVTDSSSGTECSDSEIEESILDHLKRKNCNLRENNVKLVLKIKEMENEINNFKKKTIFENSEKEKNVLKNSFEKSHENLNSKIMKLELERDNLISKVSFLENVDLKNNFEKALNDLKVFKNNVKELSSKNIVLENELAKANDSIKRLANGSENLEKLFNTAKRFGDRTGLGYTKEKDDGSPSKTVFVKAREKVDEAPKMTKEKLKVKIEQAQSSTRRVAKPKGKVGESPNKVSFVQKGKIEQRPIPAHSDNRICYLCKKTGHLKAKCEKFKHYRSHDVPIVRTTEVKKKNAFKEKKNHLFKNSYGNKNYSSNIPENKFSQKRNIPYTFFQKPHSKFIPTCLHCGKIGHTRPNCFRLRENVFANKSSFSNLPKNKVFKRGNNTIKCFHKPTCYHCGKIGHTRPNCFRLKETTRGNKNMNILTRVDFHLSELLKLGYVFNADFTNPMNVKKVTSVQKMKDRKIVNPSINKGGKKMWIPKNGRDHIVAG